MARSIANPILPSELAVSDRAGLVSSVTLGDTHAHRR